MAKIVTVIIIMMMIIIIMKLGRKRMRITIDTNQDFS